ncbi:sensor histidine kinase [Streptomyces aureoverticillatus]|uniref:sensor histidine kinase n=1 Tax=Streptomyces aureoverticillatus TaxID=66871 RepID=UPI0013DB71F0|nr:histidine kinase [Streptomyces aureoverticillatus]QIB42675.1 two-component sensor histidine kinase [Streptomyces aureoverticillatus]
MSGAARRDPWWDRYFLAPRTAGPRWTGDLVLAAMGLADCWPELVRGPWWQRLSVLAAVGALWLRRRRPAAAFVLTVPALFVAQALALSCFALSALARQRGPHGPALAAIVTVMLGDLLRWRPCRIWDDSGLAGPALADVARHLAYAVLIASAPAVVGLHYRARVELSRRVAELGALREREQRLHILHATRRERARIGWEMHDVVSHKAGLIAVQAGALSMTTTDPATRDKAETLRQLAVATLEELRTVLLVLRSDDPYPQAPTPRPGLADLATLLDRSGVEAHLHITPAVTAQALPEAHQRTVYRTVQECLTNVRKHAPGATATVTVDTDGTYVHVTVHNTPATTRTTTPLPGSGHGLPGLRERAALLGGTLTDGPSLDSGFTVRLSLPLSRVPAP